MSAVSRNSRFASSSARNSLHVDSDTATYWRSISRRSDSARSAVPGSPLSASHCSACSSSDERLVVVLALGLEPRERQQRLGRERHDAQLAEERRGAARRRRPRLERQRAAARSPAAAAGTRPSAASVVRQFVGLAELLEHLRGVAQARLHRRGVAARGVEARQRAQRDRVLDAVAEPLRQREALERVALRVVGAADHLQRQRRCAIVQFHHHVAVRRARRLLERGLDQCSAAGAVTAVEFDLGEELVGQQRLAPRAGALGEVLRLAVVLGGALELTAAAREHAHREQRLRLDRGVRHLARDAQRVAEVLLGHVPLPEAVADEAEVLVVRAHAGVQALALVDARAPARGSARPRATRAGSCRRARGC